MPIRLSLFVLFILVGTPSLFSQSAQTHDPKKFPFRAHGFLLGNYTARTSDAHSPGELGDRFLWADERLRLEISGETANGNLSFMFKGDLFHDAVVNKLDGAVREAYLDYSQAWLDLRLGRQVVTWGVGDLLFINDVLPKDWNAFFSGRPLEYLKLGVDAVKFQVSTPALNAELVVIPFFEPDNLPRAERFFFFDPFAAVRDRPLRRPAAMTGNSELALRLYRRAFESDISLHAYRGYWRQPSFHPDLFPLPAQLRGFYPRLTVYGASAQRNIGAALLSFEVGYYDSQDDRKGVDPVVPNSQLRFLSGFQRQLTNELTLVAQYYMEILNDYQAHKRALLQGFPLQGHVRHLLTVRLTQFLKYQTWRVSLFNFYSPSDQDALLILEMWHAITDRLSLTVGATIFEGQRPTTFLGQWDRNDNVYVALRFDF